MGRLSAMLKTAQDPAAMAAMGGGGMPMDPNAMAYMGGGMPMDPNAMAAMGGGGMPMDPNAMAAMGGGMPMDPNAMAAMGGAPMGGAMPPMGGMPIDPNMLAAMMGGLPPMGGEAAPSIDQDLLQQSLQVANSALDLVKAQTNKVDDMSTQLATILQASGSLEGLGPEDLQAMSAAQEASPAATV